MLRCTLVVGIAEFGCFGLGCDSGFDCSTKWLFRCVHQQAGQLSVKIYHPLLILSYEELNRMCMNFSRLDHKTNLIQVCFAC